jgi:RNA polymerase sigma factor (sigma-70 family)
MSPWLSDRLLGSQSDERLVALACAGSDRAFAAIVQRYRRPLLAFARRLGPAGDAEDLVQQTFMSALAAMRSGVEVRHLRGWLHQILRHAAAQSSKRTVAAAELGEANLSAPSAQQAAELRMLTAEALAALAELPTRQHEAIVATAIHGQTRAEVAQLLGLTEGAVRQLVHRAREALRTAVTAITPYPLAQALAAGPSGGGLADVVAGAGAGSAGALAVKIGAVLASGLVATGIVTSGIRGRSHSTHRAPGRAVASATGLPGRGGGTRLAAVRGPGSASNGLVGGEAARRGGGSGGNRSDGGPRAGSDGSSGGPSSGSGSSDGGGLSSGSSGGPSVTTASSSDGGGSGSGGSGTSGGGTTTTTSGSHDGGGSGSSDGGMTMTTLTTTTTTTTTSSGKDGGGSGGSGSGGMTTTTSTDGH